MNLNKVISVSKEDFLGFPMKGRTGTVIGIYVRGGGKSGNKGPRRVHYKISWDGIEGVTQSLQLKVVRDHIRFLTDLV